MAPLRGWGPRGQRLRASVPHRPFELASNQAVVRSRVVLPTCMLRCGRKFKVLHHSRRDARYVCASHVDPSNEKGCSAFSNMRIDAAVSAEVLRAISPLAIEAALKLIAERNQAGSEQLRQRELALEQARYEAKHARRQYDVFDPDKRRVAR